MPEDQSVPEGFFESLYRRAGGEARSVPWAAMAPNAFVTDWVERFPGPVGTAVVVGVGLGDDAEVLAGSGWSVTGFDIAPTAIAWCVERFAATSVDYVVADLGDLPPAWSGGFSLAVDVLTIQSFPPSDQRSAMQQVASLVAPGGTLLVASLGRHGSSTVGGPPWPPALGDLDEFKEQGLTEVKLSTSPSPWDGFDRIEAEYRRP